MSTKEPIVIGGQTIGRFRASWLLCKETFRFLKADPEVVAVPLVVGLVNLFLTGAIIFLYVLLVYQGVIPNSEEITPTDYAFVFILYILSAFSVAITNAVIAHIVAVRARGGDATFGQGFSAAFAHLGVLLVWSVIAATVGLVLRVLSERSQTLGRIVIAVIGVAWSVLTYFVVQAIVLEGRSAPDGIKRSGLVFRSVWGESVVSNFSLGAIFLVVYIVIISGGIGLMLLFASSEFMLVAMLVLMMFTLFVTALVSSAMGSILKTLLFIYATNTGSVQGFDQELLDRMLVKNRPVNTTSPMVDVPPAQTVTPNQMQ